ncbi:TonB-dependent receptor [Mucilaginibacter koreensis]
MATGKVNQTHIFKCSPKGLLTCLCLALAVAANAQTDTSKTLKPVVVSTSSIPKAPSLLPVQQVKSEEFKQYSAYNVADAIRNFTGVTIKDYGGIGGLKTISVRSLGAEHTALLYDGVQINDAQNGQIDLSKFNLENISQISLYNSQPPQLCQPARAFAAASVLSIKPVYPHFSANKPYQLTAGFKTGSFGLVNPYLQWQQKLSKDWALAINSNFQYANGRYKFKTTGTGEDTLATRYNTGIKSIQTDAALYRIKNDSNTLVIRVNETAQSQGLPSYYIPYAATGSQHLWTNDLFGQVSYNRQWQSSLHLLLNTKLSRSYLHYLDPDFLNDIHRLEQFYTQREVYQSVALSYQLFTGFELGYSTDFSYADLKANSYNYARPERFTLLNVISGKFSAGKWVLQGNVLNTYVNDNVQQGKALPARSIYTPALEVAFKPFGQPNFLIRAFYKNIFRNPTFNDLYYSEIGQRNLKPEFAKQYDIGAEYIKAVSGGILDFVSTSADVYYLNVKDKIIAIPTQNAFIWSIINYGKVETKGLNASVKAQTKEIGRFKYSFSVNYTFQQALNTTDAGGGTYNNQIPYTPEHVVNLNAGVIFQRLSLYYNQIISSHRYYLNENINDYKLPGYTISDISLNYNTHLSTKPCYIGIEVNNLFNKQYQVIRSFPMPGTSVRFVFQITI